MKLTSGSPEELATLSTSRTLVDLDFVRLIRASFGSGMEFLPTGVAFLRLCTSSIGCLTILSMRPEVFKVFKK